MAVLSSILTWRTPGIEEPGGLIVHGITKSWKQLSDLTHKFQSIWLSQDFFLSFQSEYSSLIIRIYHFSSWSSGMK